jgi:hypothetical protein
MRARLRGVEQVVGWRRQGGLATALTVLFAIVVAVLLVRAAALGTRLYALGDTESLEFASRARGADSFVSTTDVVAVLVILAIIPCFIVWNWRAAKNQEALGRRPERLGPGFAIGGWFMPLANLVIPVLVIQDLWRGADARIARGDPRWRIADRSWLVGAWWGLSLVTSLTFAGAPADQRDFDAAVVRGQNLVALISMLCGATAAVLAVLVIRRLNARQEECRAAQESAAVATATQLTR